MPGRAVRRAYPLRCRRKRAERLSQRARAGTALPHPRRSSWERRPGASSYETAGKFLTPASRYSYAQIPRVTGESQRSNGSGRARMSASSYKLRTGRASEEGGYYLLTSCCRNRIAFFSNPDSAQIVLSCARWLDEHGVIELKGVVVMPDHVHLVLGLGGLSLSQVMHRFKSYTSHAVARLVETDGGVWQRGYHDHGIRDESALRVQVEYCLLNPVRAGFVKDFHDYPHWWCCWEV